MEITKENLIAIVDSLAQIAEKANSYRKKERKQAVKRFDEYIAKLTEFSKYQERHFCFERDWDMSDGEFGFEYNNLFNSKKYQEANKLAKKYIQFVRNNFIQIQT